MTKDKFLEICHYLKHILDGSDFVSHTYVVGGAVRDFVMGNEIKDIDLVVSLPFQEVLIWRTGYMIMIS